MMNTAKSLKFDENVVHPEPSDLQDLWSELTHEEKLIIMKIKGEGRELTKKELLALPAKCIQFLKESE